MRRNVPTFSCKYEEDRQFSLQAYTKFTWWWNLERNIELGAHLTHPCNVISLPDITRHSMGTGWFVPPHSRQRIVFNRRVWGGGEETYFQQSSSCTYDGNPSLNANNSFVRRLFVTGVGIYRNCLSNTVSVLISDRGDIEATVFRKTPARHFLMFENVRGLVLIGTVQRGLEISRLFDGISKNVHLNILIFVTDWKNYKCTLLKA